MVIKSTSEVVIDLLQTDEFTEAHLELTWEIYESHWKTFYPELYGDKLPDAIEFEKFDLMPALARTGVQKNRAGGKTTRAKYLEIKQNIERNGWKLKYPPISWFRWSDNPDGCVTITGDTRGEIVAHAPFQTNNLIVAIYKRKPGYTDAQVQDAIDACGLRFNAIHDPAAPLSTADVKYTVTNMVQRYLDTNGEAGVAPTMDEITKRVDYVCGEGVFQPATRQFLIYEIYNNFNPEDIVVSWSDNKLAKYRISSFLTRNSWVDTDKVKYVHTSFELYSKAFTRACDKAAEFPDAEVRIVIHTGTLKGYSLRSVYTNRIQKFISRFKNILNAVAGASDNGATFSRIKIYGALPALGSVHNLDVPFYVNERSGKLYQRGALNTYTFDIVEDDEVENTLEEFFEEKELDEAA
jgi:hypothetical protein